MLNSNLFSLILNHFILAKLNCVVLFHCWNKYSITQFSNLASQHSIYSQYADLNDSAALHNFGFRYMRYDQPQIGVFLDLNCYQADNFIGESSRQRLFNYRYNWLIYDELSNFPRFKEIFSNVNLSVDTRLTHVVPKQTPGSPGTNETAFVAFDVYNNGWFLGGALNITINYEIRCHETGCQTRKYLSDLYKRRLYGNRESLRDVTMRVSVVVTRFDIKAPEEEILNFLLTEKDFHLDPINKFGMQIFRLIQESLYTKVSFTYYDRWTDKDIKGGMIGALIDETADFTSGSFFYTTGRFRFLTPIAQTGLSRSVCVFRTPRNSGIQGRVFLDPFTGTVWMMFGIILVVSAIFLWAIFFVEFRKMRRVLHIVPSLLTTFLISFGSACAQGSFLIPGSLAGRVAFISLSLLTFIMYNYYTSVVVSSLLGSPVKSKIKTLADLADSDLEIGLEPLPYTYTYLNFSTLPVVRHFVKRKIEGKNNLWYSAQEGINKIRFKPGFVFIFEAQSGYFIIENQYEPHEICDLNEILFRSDALISQHLHKNSSYKEILRLKIVRIFETGVFSKHRRLWVRTRLNCLSNSFLLSVGMEYAAPLFLLLVCGYLFVFIVLAMEIAWHRFAKNMKRRAAAAFEDEHVGTED